MPCTQLLSSEEISAALLGRVLTAIVFFLDQISEELSLLIVF